MSHVVILGAGVMGSAFATPLADAGHRIGLVGTHLDEDIIASVRQNRFHPRLKAHLPACVTSYSHGELPEAMWGAEIVILGVSSAGLDWAGDKLRNILPETAPIVVLTKGLRGDGETIHILPDVLRHRLPPAYRGAIYAIGGPCIAGELAARRQTWATLAGPDAESASQMANNLRTSYYHLEPSSDLTGVEICAALKNLYALGVGMAAGISRIAPPADNEARMHNTAAGLFTRALSELEYLVVALGGKATSVRTLAGAGDLYVTCQAGRNSRMGALLGQGMRYSDAKAGFMSGDTIEGAETALAIGVTMRAMIARGQLDGKSLPLTRAIVDMICDNSCGNLSWDEIFSASLA